MYIRFYWNWVRRLLRVTPALLCYADDLCWSYTQYSRILKGFNLKCCQRAVFYFYFYFLFCVFSWVRVNWVTLKEKGASWNNQQGLFQVDEGRKKAHSFVLFFLAVFKLWSTSKQFNFNPKGSTHWISSNQGYPSSSSFPVLPDLPWMTWHGRPRWVAVRFGMGLRRCTSTDSISMFMWCGKSMTKKYMQ